MAADLLRQRVAVIAAIGNIVGGALFWLIAERRRVVRINLEKCFPQMPQRAIATGLVDGVLPVERMPGALIEYGPVDQSYGYREYSARDSEGGLWTFMTPLD